MNTNINLQYMQDFIFAFANILLIEEEEETRKIFKIVRGHQLEGIRIKYKKKEG